MKRLTTDQFIELAIKVHGDKYDYSKVNYTTSLNKIIIICKVHDEFEQTPNAHLSKKGCMKCGFESTRKILSSNKKQFISSAVKIHGNTYDYSKVDYITATTKVKIICSKHGEFEQFPYVHLKGHGCNKCANQKINNGLKLTTDKFIERAIKIHCWKYNYKFVKYINSNIKVKIICHNHGIFNQRPQDHINQHHGCPKCSHQVSKPELEICSFLDEYNIDYEQSNRSILNGKELDIVIPSKRIAIEFNGLYWHSETFKGTKYHQTKYELSKEKGYQLISIFEPEWVLQKEIVKSIILAKLNIYETKIGARKCELKEIVAPIARQFFDANHIQGFSGGTHIGLFYKDQLVSCISFRKNKKDYELTRFVNKKNTLVHGAFSKLLKYFINNNSFESIFTFADLRYFEGKVYEKNGFRFVHEVVPSYYYFKGLELFHKRNFQHKILKEKFKNYDSKLTEYQNCLNNEYDRVWDCGKLKFELI
jgi:G:T-mismatch repair DNA endonuclease (very short patch repair protein)